MNAEHTAAAPEPFALARRGLPLITRNATPPRAVWLPPQLCSRAQPVMQRTMSVVVAPEVPDETQAWLQDVPKTSAPTPQSRDEEPWWMEAAEWVPVQDTAPATVVAPMVAPAPRDVAPAVTTVTAIPASTTPTPLNVPASRIETVVREQLAPQTLSSALSQPAAAPAAVRPASTAPAVSKLGTSHPPVTQASATPPAVTREQLTQLMHTPERVVSQTVLQPIVQPGTQHAEVQLTPTATLAATFIEVARTEYEPKASTLPAATERMGAVSTPAPPPNMEVLSSPVGVAPQPAAITPAPTTERERAATALADIRAAAAAPVPRSVHIERIAVTVNTPEPTRAQPSVAPVLHAAAMPSSAAAGARSYRSAWSSYFVRRD